MQQSIQRSTATALESERIGTEVIEDLNYQRERLSGARDRLQEANTGNFLKLKKHKYFIDYILNN